MTEIPVRCFTCGKVVGNKWLPYVRARKEGKNLTEALDTLNLPRPCCKRMILCHIDLSERHLKFQAMETVNSTGLNMTFTGDEYGDGSDDD